MDGLGVGGHDNRVAQRDYYEQPIIIQGPPARPIKPGLVPCPACGVQGLAPNALSCPGCGHDFMVARLQAYRLRQAKRGLWNMTLVAAVLTVFNVYVMRGGPLWRINLTVVVLLWGAVAVAWLVNWWRWR